MRWNLPRTQAASGLAFAIFLALQTSHQEKTMTVAPVRKMLTKPVLVTLLFLPVACQNDTRLSHAPGIGARTGTSITLLALGATRLRGEAL